MRIKWIYIFVILLTVSCTEKGNKRPELIQDFDQVYLTKDEVKVKAEPLDPNFDKIFLEDLQNIMLSLDSTKSLIPIKYRLYIGKNGKVERVKNMSKSIIDLIKNKYTSREAEIFTESEMLAQKMISTFSELEFNPALNDDGKPVLYREDIEALFIKNENGNLELKLDLDIKFDFNNENDKEYFLTVDEMPSPIGGVVSIQKKVRYPELARNAGIEGRVFIKAFIDEGGNVIKAEIIKGIGSGCDEAALNAVRETKFNPGRQNGKAVKTQVSIPILFQLQ